MTNAALKAPLFHGVPTPMIRSLWIYQIAKSVEDFNLVVRLLEELGIKGVQSHGSEGGRFAAFFPPDARFHFFSPGDKSSFQAPDLYVDVPDPFAALDAAKNLGFRIVSDTSPEQVSDRGFRAELPGGSALIIGGPIPNPALDKIEALKGSLSAEGKRFGLVVSRFNSFITERLLQGSVDALLLSGIDQRSIAIVRVPGSFEIPSAARTLAETNKYDAIICLGCLLRGDTAHYDVIVNEVTRGIGQSAQETGVPHAFGVLTCDTLEQAIDRAGLKMGNKGFEAALAAVEMANLRKAVVGRRSLAVGKNKNKAPQIRSGTSRRKRKR
jgi:6,7-dimethyl-8-ribityllumazine synthase